MNVVDMERCPEYVGVVCVDGSCPIALQDEYQEYGMPVIRSCMNCPFYKGCEDCALYGTEYCDGVVK